MFRNVYIFGLGMMGGSLAHAIKRGKNCKKVYAYDTCRQSLLFAKKNLLIDGNSYPIFLKKFLTH